MTSDRLFAIFLNNVLMYAVWHIDEPVVMLLCAESLVVAFVQWRETRPRWHRRASRSSVSQSTVSLARWSAWLVYQTLWVVVGTASLVQLHRRVPVCHRRHRRLTSVILPVDCHWHLVNPVDSRWHQLTQLFVSSSVPRFLFTSEYSWKFWKKLQQVVFSYRLLNFSLCFSEFCCSHMFTRWQHCVEHDFSDEPDFTVVCWSDIMT